MRQFLGHGALLRERQVVSLVEEVEAFFQVRGVEHRAERGLDALASQRRERDGLAARIDDVQQPFRDVVAGVVGGKGADASRQCGIGGHAERQHLVPWVGDVEGGCGLEVPRVLVPCACTGRRWPSSAPPPFRRPPTSP